MSKVLFSETDKPTPVNTSPQVSPQEIIKKADDIKQDYYKASQNTPSPNRPKPNNE